MLSTLCREEDQQKFEWSLKEVASSKTPLQLGKEMILGLSLWRCGVAVWAQHLESFMGIRKAPGLSMSWHVHDAAG